MDVQSTYHGHIYASMATINPTLIFLSVLFIKPSSNFFELVNIPLCMYLCWWNPLLPNHYVYLIFDGFGILLLNNILSDTLVKEMDSMANTWHYCIRLNHRVLLLWYIFQDRDKDYIVSGPAVCKRGNRGPWSAPVARVHPRTIYHRKMPLRVRVRPDNEHGNGIGRVDM